MLITFGRVVAGAAAPFDSPHAAAVARSATPITATMTLDVLLVECEGARRRGIEILRGVGCDDPPRADRWTA
jgi:hypothetical protein